MKKTTRKVLALTSGAALLVSASVMGTMAYLTAETAEVKNTFTVGNVSFDKTVGDGLDEAKVDAYGEYVTDEKNRVTTNEYKLIPGRTYIKDPTVRMSENSEDCYLFVKVVNGIEALEAEGLKPDGNTEYTTKTIAEQMAEYNWEEVPEETNIYYYYADRTDDNDELPDGLVSAGEDVVVFDSFTLKDDAVFTDYVNEDGSVKDSTKITIQAFAVQADGFASPTDAWTKTKANNETPDW